MLISSFPSFLFYSSRPSSGLWTGGGQCTTTGWGGGRGAAPCRGFTWGAAGRGRADGRKNRGRDSYRNVPTTSTSKTISPAESRRWWAQPECKKTPLQVNVLHSEYYFRTEVILGKYTEGFRSTLSVLLWLVDYNTLLKLIHQCVRSIWLLLNLTLTVW